MRKMKTVAVVMLLCLFVITFSVSAEENSINNSNEITIYEKLQEAMAGFMEGDTIEIYVWLPDIEVFQIKDEIMKNQFGDVSFDDISIEEMHDYISACRKQLMVEYMNSNSRIIDSITKVCGNIDVKFISCYAPMCILRLSKAQLDRLLTLDKGVVAVDLFENLDAKSESDIANYNSGATYVRDSLGYTGSGIKIGMIEPGNPLAITAFNSYFNTNKVHILGSIINTGYEDNIHATRVAAIMVGSGTTFNSITYKGIAPDADLYCIQCTNVIDFFTGIQELLNNDVDVINMSMGFGPQTQYTLMNLWIDHIAYVEDVHVVKSAGNKGDSNPNSIITYPGLSYNIVTVGAYDDNNNTIDYSGPSTISQQTLNSNSFCLSSYTCFNEGSSGICKPDLVAAGTHIKYGGLLDSYLSHDISSGTSFAAPQVTAVMAQLMQANPALVNKQDQMKAILCASAIYRLSNDQLEQSSNDPRYEYCLYEKQGSGVLNANLARYIALTSGKAQSFYLYGSTSTIYTYNIYAYSSDIYLRVALPWLKRSNMTVPPTSNTWNAITSTSDLADYDVTITAPNGLIAYSNSSVGNMELIQLNTSEYGYGTYTITVQIKTNNNINNYLGLAWF